MWCSTKHCRIIRDKLVYVCRYIICHAGSTPAMSTIFMITLFGSCRIGAIDNNNLHEETTFTHNTKEVIQLIKFLKGELEFKNPYDVLCFRTGIIKNTPVIFTSELKRCFEKSFACVVEICSRKKYIHDGYYLHHLCVDKRFKESNEDTPNNVMLEYRLEHQSDDEITQDVLEIKELLKDKTLVLACHYNALMNGEYIRSRAKLINLVRKISKDHNIPLIDPNEIFKNELQKDILHETLGHYTGDGYRLIKKQANLYMKNLLNLA